MNEFKVAIITKSEWYGIKKYVVADAETFYVPKYMVYTGNDMVYSSTTDPEDKKYTIG